MFCPVVRVVLLAWAPIESELLLAFSIAEPVEGHVHCFGSFGLDFAIDMTASAIALSVWMGVGGCLWPISLSIIRM
jgi:hypothetical protein